MISNDKDIHSFLTGSFNDFSNILACLSNRLDSCFQITGMSNHIRLGKIDRIKIILISFNSGN